MTVLETLDFWALSEMATECYEAMFLLFANARGAGTLLTVKCPTPGSEHILYQMPGVCPGRKMLAAGIASYITV